MTFKVQKMGFMVVWASGNIILVHVELVHNFTYPISFKFTCYTTDVANKILKFSDAFMDITFYGSERLLGR